jgi:hypothetical protein
LAHYLGVDGSAWTHQTKLLEGSGMNRSLALPETTMFAITAAAPSFLSKSEGSAAVHRSDDNRRHVYHSQNPNPAPTPYSWNTADLVAPEVLELWRTVGCEIDDNQNGTLQQSYSFAGSLCDG